MGRSRVVVVGLATIVGVAAIVAGVRISTRDNTARLATENTLIPEAGEPTQDEASEPDETATTFDLGLLVPTTTQAPKSTTTTVPGAPRATTTTVSKAFAVVHVNNNSVTPVRVWLGDASEHAEALPAGEGVNWIVKTSAGKHDVGGVVVDGTSCGAKWSDADNVVGGHEYHFEIKPSPGLCANGQVMPQLVITDYTAGASKTVTGLVPNANHALLYVVNTYGAAAKVNVNDVDALEWTIDPTEWGAPQLLTTATGHGDGVSVTRIDEACGYGDGENYFLGGHTYRIEVVDGTGSCDGSGGPSPGLVIHDLTAGTTRSVGA